MEAAAKPRPAAPASLYPLAASAALLQDLHKRSLSPPVAAVEDDESDGRHGWRQELLSPRAAVLKNRVIDEALRFLTRYEGSGLIVN